MKNVLFALLMMAMSIPAFADRSHLMEDMDDCAYNAIKQTQYSTRASATPDNKKAAFDAFINAEVKLNPQAEHLIRNLGSIAWEERKEDPVNVGYATYHICLDQSGVRS